MCPSCGTTDHDGTTCLGPISCFNCCGPHQASSKDGDRYTFKREVPRTTEKIDFAEAKRRVLTTHIRSGVTYATMLSSLPNRRRKMTVTVHQVAKPHYDSHTNAVVPAALPSISMEVSEELNQAPTATPSPISVAEVRTHSRRCPFLRHDPLYPRVGLEGPHQCWLWPSLLPRCRQMVTQN